MLERDGASDGATAARTARASGTTTTPGSRSGGSRSSTCDERSNQPLHLGPLHLVFNGEIYNYRELRDELRGLGHAFDTEGDGEVLLHALGGVGRGALDRAQRDVRLRDLGRASGDAHAGVAIRSARSRSTARTRGERIVFASEIQALLRAPDVGAAHDDALAAFLARGAMPPIDESFFAGVERLPAAHCCAGATARDGRGATGRRAPVEVPARVRATPSSELRELLRRLDPRCACAATCRSARR